ncbi:MAG: hypothetical protein HY718_07710 [Planctomycetes bacterium]|nr:hypothetical protein [Planctomycetota bacterium]
MIATCRLSATARRGSTAAVLALGWIIACGALWTGGCVPPPGNLVTSGVTGEMVDLDEVNAILDNPGLDASEMRDQLRELGLSEDLIGILVPG